MAQTQTYKNHGRFDPMFHYFVAPIALLNVIFMVIWVVRHYPAHLHLGIWMIVMSVAFLVLVGMARSYALKVQDRVIRLEERLRLASLATESELAELESLTVKQYVGLRFASNPELLDLARRAVRENLTNKQIKESVKSWRADVHRV